jgi:putative ABC transport system permease protein
MRLFLKKFYRDLSETRGQFLSVLLVVAVGVMFYSGLNSTLGNLEGSGRSYFREYRLADLWCSVYRAPESVVKRIEALPGVSMATGRIVQDARIGLGDGEAIVRLISLPDEKDAVANDIMLKSGRHFSSEAGNQCIVSDTFLKANHLSLGQVLEPILNGDRVKLKIVGTAQSPEYVLEVRDGNQMLPDPEKFGLIYVKESHLQNLLDLKDSVNEISLLLDDGGESKEVEQELERILQPYGLSHVTERKNQLGYAAFENELRTLRAMIGIFPILFFIVSAVIIYITMTRIIENQRTQIGVLKALGYGNGAILLHYLTYPFLVGVLGSIAGSLAGIFVINRGLLDMFGTQYNLPVQGTAVHAESVLPAALLALFFCILAGYNACKRELDLVPAQSMRQRPPAGGKRIMLEGIGLLWRRISFNWKIIFRNLFRYKKRSAMASTGIIFSMALIVAAFGYKNSVDDLMTTQFTDIQKYDIKISFSKIMDVDELNSIRSIRSVQSVEGALETGMEITNGWNRKDIGLIALQDDAALFGILDGQGREVSLPREGILLPERLLNTLQMQVGERAFLRSYYPGKNQEEDRREAPVKGAIAQYSGQSAICSLDYLDYLLQEGPLVDTAYIKVENPGDERDVVEELEEILAISAIQSKGEAEDTLREAMGTMITVIAFMIAGAGILAFAVIYNITNINIFERRREIATLTVLGFTAGELKSLVFNENYFVSAFGILTGIPLGKLLLDLSIGMAKTDTLELFPSLSLVSYVMAALMVAGFTVLANLLLTKKILSINMVESLKSAE